MSTFTEVAPLSIILELSRTEEADDANAFRFAPQSYTLRTSGGGRELFEVSWDKQLLADIEAVRLPGRDPDVVQRVGNMLHRCLRAVGWKAYSRTIMRAADAGRMVIITIRSNAAELYVLPWELLTLSGSGQHLGELSHVLVRYEWPETATTPEQPSPRPAGGRILLAWSAAAGAVPAREHSSAIAHACALGHHPFHPEQDVLAHASVDKLVDKLQQAQEAGEPYAALHLLCHGGQAGSGFGLVLNGDSPGSKATLDAARTRQCLAPFAHSMRLVVLAACDAANTGALGNHLGSIAQTLHRAGMQSVVASRYPLSVAGSTRLTQVLYRTLLSGPSALETALVTARAELAREGGSRSSANLDWASLQFYGRDRDGHDTRPIVFRPYRGLLAFQAHHSRFFFGREAERRETLSDLEELGRAGLPRLLVVAGASGTGKSSMVLAGAIPDLTQHDEDDQSIDIEQLLRRARHNLELAARSSGRASLRRALDVLDQESVARAQHRGNWEVYVMRPGSQPLDNLHEALARFRNSSRSFVLVIDQFEELFTHTEDADARSRFARKLWALASEDNDFHCIITIRIDFLGRCGEIVLDDSGIRLDKVAYDEAHRVFVAQMARQQLREAIEGPAQRVGLRLSEGLTERLLSDVGHEPGALPLLQYTLDRLWERREGRLLSAAAYDELGGVVGALQQRADAIIDALSSEQQQQARRLMTRLVSFGDDGTDTRRRLPIEQLIPSDEVRLDAFEHALARLVNARLLVRSEEAGARTLEVAHEALIRKWQRLRSWLQEDRVKLSELDKLEAWALQWDEHKVALTGAQLGYAIEVAERYPDDIDGLTKRMLDDSRSREKRRRNGWIAAFAGAVVLALSFIAIGTMALAEANRATQAQQTAEANEQLAEANAERAKANAQRAKDEALLARDAQRMAAARATRDRALAIGFMRELESADPLSMPGWREKAALALVQPLTVHRFDGHTAQVTALAHHPSKPQFLTGSHDKTARIWSRKTGQLVHLLEGHQSAVRAATYNSDGTTVATGSGDGALWLWNSKDGQKLTQLAGHEKAVTSISFHPNKRQLVSGSEDGSVKLWDIDSGEVLKQMPVPPETKTSVMFHPKEEQIAVATAKVDYDNPQTHIKHVLLWDITSGRKRPLELTDHPVSALAWNERGDTIITGSLNHEAVLLWPGRTKNLDLTRHLNDVLSVSFHSDGLHVVTGSADRTVLVWSTETGRVLTELAGDLSEVGAVTYCPHDNYIITGSYDGKVRLWRVGTSYSFTPPKQEQLPFYTVAYSPDGQTLAGSSYSTVWLWGAADGAGVKAINDSGSMIYSMSFHADGTQLATGHEDGKVRLWSLQPKLTQKPLRTIAAHESPVTEIRWTPEGGLITFALQDDALTVWDAEGTPVTTPPLPTQASRIAFCGAAAEKRIATITEEGVAVQDIATGKEQFSAQLEGHDILSTIFACSPDGSKLAGGHLSTGMLQVWSTDTGAKLFQAQESAAITALSFTPNGKHILTGLDPGTLTFRNSATGSLVLKADRHTERIVGIDHNHNASHFATSSSDGTVQIWENGLKLLETDTKAEYPVEQLWRSTSVCPTLAERNQLLGATWQGHAQDYQSCQTMVSCINAPNANFDSCLSNFRGALKKVHEGDPNATQ